MYEDVGTVIFYVVKTKLIVSQLLKTLANVDEIQKVILVFDLLSNKDIYSIMFNGPCIIVLVE